MNIPFFDLKRQYALIKEDVEKAIIDVSESCGYIEGSAVKDFTRNMEDYLGVKHVVTCNSGTDALEIALKACGIKPGDEVITSAFSFFATAEAISAIGAIPVFADVLPSDYNIDPESVKRVVTDKTKAILPVHIFGSPANIDALREIAEDKGLKIIEDACQAIGSSKNGIKAGGLGDIAAFSFYPTKNLGAFGDGGMITTNDDELATVCQALKAHAGGKNGYDAAMILGADIGEFASTNQEATDLYDPFKYFNYMIGGNSRLDSIQAAVLDVKLKRLNEFNESRARIADMYNSAFADLPIHMPEELNGNKNCWHQYVILTEKKEEMIAHLQGKGIGVGAFYPVPLHLQKAFANLGYKEGDFPVAERLCKQTVCLPVFPELTDDEIGYVIEAVEDFFDK